MSKKGNKSAAKSAPTPAPVAPAKSNVVALPKPKTPPPPPVVADDEDLDEDDPMEDEDMDAELEDEATAVDPDPPAAAPEAPKTKGAKLPPAKLRATQLRRMATRLQALVAKRMKSWTPSHPSLDEAVLRIGESVGALRAGADALDKLPDTYGAAGEAKGGGGGRMAIGTAVALRDKVAKSYEDVLDPEDFKHCMKVVKMTKGKCVVLTHKKEKLIFPRGHLRIVEE